MFDSQICCTAYFAATFFNIFRFLLQLSKHILFHSPFFYIEYFASNFHKIFCYTVHSVLLYNIYLLNIFIKYFVIHSVLFYSIFGGTFSLNICYIFCFVVQHFLAKHFIKYFVYDLAFCQYLFTAHFHCLFCLAFCLTKLHLFAA